MEDIKIAIASLMEEGPSGIARFAESLEPEWIEEALQATGSGSIRRRKLPSERAVWLVLGMGLFADRSIKEVVDHLGLVLPGVKSLSPSAIPQARYRIGHEPMRWLFYTVAEAWADTQGGKGFHDLNLYGIDGCCVARPKPSSVTHRMAQIVWGSGEAAARPVRSSSVPERPPGNPSGTTS